MASTLHNKQGEQWPEVTMVRFARHLDLPRAPHGPERPEATFVGDSVWLAGNPIPWEGPAGYETEPYVPASRLSEVEAERDEAKNWAKTLEDCEAGDRAAIYHTRAVEAEERADRLQAIIDSLTQQEAVEAATTYFLAGYMNGPLSGRVAMQGAIERALQSAKEQVEGKADRG